MITRIVKNLVFTMVIVLLVSTNAFAGNLGTNASGIYYVKDDGLLATSEWITLDLDSDGMLEYYFFNDGSILLTNTTTPDGYQVNERGQWVENGIVKTVSSGVTNTNQNIIDANWLHLDLGHGVVYDGPKILITNYTTMLVGGDMQLEDIKILKKEYGHYEVGVKLRKVNERSSGMAICRLCGYDNQGFKIEDVAINVSGMRSSTWRFDESVVRITLENPHY